LKKFILGEIHSSLGFSQGGKVSSVRAKVGDKVARGAVIASVENGDLRAGLEQKQAALLREQTKLKSLEGSRKMGTAWPFFTTSRRSKPGIKPIRLETTMNRKKLATQGNMFSTRWPEICLVILSKYSITISTKLCNQEG